MFIQLMGCTPEPLGSYLKALAVLRLVAEQRDPEARGWWEGTCFCLESDLDQDKLVTFFREAYRPTPILAPWNGGSGFYPKDPKLGIEAIENSQPERFAVYREAIRLAKGIPGVGQEKQSVQADEDKERRLQIQLDCRNRLPDVCVDWLDAAVGISADNKRTFPPILGTGGNDGRLEYTNTFMQSVARLLIAPDSKTPVEPLLRNALFGVATSGFQPGSVGQYDPGRAGGFNQGQGVEAADFPSNPWNAVLAMEGTVAWAAGLHRRQGTQYRSFLCSPFTVGPSAVGYGSASAKDGSKGGPFRAEIWAPLWNRPARYAEIKTLLREGRASVHGKPAQNGLEFAQAACMLGVDRGISGFVRYNLLMRRGKSYIALSAGRFGVHDPRKETDLTRELTPLLEDFDRQLREAPTEYGALRRQVDDAIFSLLLRGGREALLDLATSVGREQRWILSSGRAVRSGKRLTKSWAAALCPTSAEARIAAALAGTYDREAGSLRDHLDRDKAQFAWTGQRLEHRMAHVLERRVLLGDAAGSRHNALGSAYRASVQDVDAFLEGTLDDDTIEDLMFAFTLVNWTEGEPIDPPDGEAVGWPIYVLLKHLFLPHGVRTPDGEKNIIADLGVLSALSADRIDDAAQIGLRRLQNVGLTPVDTAYQGGFDGARLAASLLIPVRYGSAMRRIFKLQEERQ